MVICKSMRKIVSTILIALISFSFSSFANSADEMIDENETELNFFTGMFDFSDDKQASGLLGLQHQSDELFRKSFLGTLSPITGAMISADNAVYFYTGVQAQYKVGKINLNPSFSPGIYEQGDGKDLGHAVEFKSEIQLSLDLFDNSQFGMSYNHISNASLGEKNPGANSYMFNFLQKF